MNNFLASSNKLIQKSIMRMYPACFAAALAGSMSLLVDSLLAGSMISRLAIAAVAIGNPVTAVFRALLQAISNGAIVRLTISIGRGKREESNRTYSLGLSNTLILGTLFTALVLITADKLVLVFGGSSNPEAAAMAALYLRACSPMILGSTLNLYLTGVLGVYGHQKDTFMIATMGAIANIVASIAFIKILPEGSSIAGLGLGTTVGSLLQVIMCLIALVRRKVPLKIKRAMVKPAELMDMLKLGFPSSANNLVDGLISAVVNNIILRGFGGDALALSVYTAVKGVFSFAQVPGIAGGLAASPLFGLLYGARDKNGIKRTLRETYKAAIIFSVFWCAALIFMMPVLLKIFGMADAGEMTSVVRKGVYTTMMFIPVIQAVRIMTALFESTERFTMGLLYSITPDSIIYPLALVVLLPNLKYTGLWLALGANGVIFLIGLYLVRSMIEHTIRMSSDRLLYLDESVRDNVPKMDISIFSDAEDISSICSKAHDFIIAENADERSAYMTALCMEELAADFSAYYGAQKSKRELMDVKLFSDTDSIRIIIRSAGKPYNPLDIDQNDDSDSKVGVKLAQKVAARIDYAYVYKMNIITIDLAK